MTRDGQRTACIEAIAKSLFEVATETNMLRAEAAFDALPLAILPTRRRRTVTPLEKVKKYTNIKPVIMEDAPDAHNVFLVVGGQSFKVTPFACDTKPDAEWMQAQLCIALSTIVADLANPPEKKP